ncbi:hypothetical protein BDF14DRAFT_1749587 [Spinellus fusiger]|nr:hypothetical protein BDF14DRAFT_1749587 [Spinellus fusiger]
MDNINNSNTVPEPMTKEFPNKEALVEYAMTFTHKYGYVLNIKRSKKDSAGIIRSIDLKCSRGGHYNNRFGLNEESRKRKSTSKLTGCPFTLKGRRRVGVWHLEVSEGSHNHEPLPVSTNVVADTTELPCTQENPLCYLPHCDIGRPELMSPPSPKLNVDEAIKVLREEFSSWSEEVQKDIFQAIMRKKRVSPLGSPVISPVSQDLVVRKISGRPVEVRNRDGNSTSKELLAFDHVESERLGRRCVLCQQMGHNKRTCKVVV